MNRPTDSDSRSDGSDDFEFQVADPIERSTTQEKQLIAAAERAERLAAKNRPKPPKFPLLTGVFNFPWYLDTLECWIILSAALLVSAFTFGLWMISQTVGMGLIYIVGRSFCLLAIFTFAYASCSSMRIIEQTSQGADVVEGWPTLLEWRDWGWSFLYVAAVLLQAGLFGLFTYLLTGMYAWWTALPAVYLAFPVLLLSAMEADTWLAWSPVVLKSLTTHAWAWAIIYLEIAVLIVLLAVVTLAGLLVIRYWVIIIACPLLAAVMLISARLLGRLVWCVGHCGSIER